MSKLDAAIDILEGWLPGKPEGDVYYNKYMARRIAGVRAAIRILEAAAKMPGPEARLFWSIVQKKGNVEWPEMDALLAALPDEEAK